MAVTMGQARMDGKHIFASRGRETSNYLCIMHAALPLATVQQHYVVQQQQQPPAATQHHHPASLQQQHHHHSQEQMLYTGSTSSVASSVAINTCASVTPAVNTDVGKCSDLLCRAVARAASIQYIRTYNTVAVLHCCIVSHREGLCCL